MVETDEHRERLFNAHEALARYHALDQQIPVGMLPAQTYANILLDCTEVNLSPKQNFDVACVHLEYAMAMMRSDVDYATEAPYTPRQINAAFEAARDIFKDVYRHPAASRLLVARARVAHAGVEQYKEIVAGKPRLNTARRYVPYLNTIRAVATDFLASPDSMTDDERRFLQALTVASLTTAHMFESGWGLPAVSRQPWNVTAYSAEVSKQDVPIYIGPTDDPSVLALNVDDTFTAMRAYLKIDPDFQPDAKPKHQKHTPAFAKYEEKVNDYLVTEKFQRRLLEQITTHLLRQAELGVDISVMDRIKIHQNEAIPERAVSESVMWYFLDFDGDTLDPNLTNNLKALNRLRQRGVMLPEERSVLAWMQLDYARLLALEAGNDKQKRDFARGAFGDSIELFESLDRMYQRLRRVGNAYDAKLAACAADVMRGLYTSSDKYRLRTIVDDYHKNIGTPFVKLKVPSDSDQLEAWQHALNRATLSLLQAAAVPEMRHLLLPASPRVGSTQVGIAFPVIYDERASGYDISAPIAVDLVDGDGIAVEPRRVRVGRNTLILDNDPLALLRKLSGYLAKPKSVLDTRAQELSEGLAYAISDADQ